MWLIYSVRGRFLLGYKCGPDGSGKLGVRGDGDLKA